MTQFDRNRSLKAFKERNYDVIVVGAGMTGAGVAVDAASRGLSVCLVDAGDFACGTSSKSSKMVHGGLRYLQKREFRLVYENLRERQRLLNNAPYLVRPLPFLIPLFGKDGLVSKTVTKAYRSALRLYDITGGWRIGQRYRQITKDEALHFIPSLKVDSLVAGFLYMDARGDDARVALTLAKTASDLGADVANYVRVTGVRRNESNYLCGAVCTDVVTGESFTINATSLVNATGVWADSVFTMTEGEVSRRITPAKGVHISVPAHRLSAQVAAVLNVPGDRRSIFVVPFEDAPYTFIGTTDTAYQGSLDSPLCTSEDIAYLLRAVNASTSAELTEEDVTGVWAGLRPLLAPKNGKSPSERTADLSRRHQVTDSGDGVVHITGGKWTTYRQMAQDTVDALSPYVHGLSKSKTKTMPLHGCSNWRPDTELALQLFQRYGDDARTLLQLINWDESLSRPLIDGQPYVGAEFVYGVTNEMAASLTDLLTRRTRAHLHDARATLRAAPVIAAVVAPHAGWDADEMAKQVEEYAALVRSELTSAGLSL